MRQLRRWLVGVMATVTTLISILGIQTLTFAQPPELTLEAAGLTLEELTDGVYGLIASTDFPPSSPNAAICNGGIVIGDDGVLVVDPFQSEELAELLYATVATLTDQPIRFVANTHYHFDHTGANALADSLGYPILGRGPIREFMLTRNLEMDPNATAPDIVVQGSWEIWLGDRQVQISEFDGHSGGTDLVLYVPDADVLFAGDLLFNERIPYVADGNIRAWQASLAQLAQNYATATVLPGHGPVTDDTGFDALKGYLDDLEALALAWKEQGLSQADAIATTSVPEQYANYLFQGLFPSNLEAAYQQITLGNDDTAAIQAYFAQQAPALQAL
jgi:cyclase